MKAPFISSGTGDRRPHAFSVVEALVVLMVLVVLAGLLFPAGSRLMDKSRTVSCIHHLRQLGIGVTLWRKENGDRLMTLITLKSRRPSQYLYEGGVIAKAEGLCCPAASTREKGAWYDITASTWGNPYQDAFLNQPISYGVNALAFYQSYPSGWGGGITITTSYRMFTGKEHHVPLFMDAKGFQIDHGMWKDRDRSGRFACRHSERCNTLFLDGHVESLTLEEVRLLHPLGDRGKIY